MHNQHFVSAQQITKEMFDRYYRLALKLKKISQTEQGRRYLLTTLEDKRALLYFVQPSSRTVLSFQNACYLLGAKVSEIRDVSLTSEAKGESNHDTLRTFAAYVDLLIVRHKSETLVHEASRLYDTLKYPVNVVNAGSGTDEHPTQAMLDLMTMEEHFAPSGGVSGKTICLVGDLKRGRTVRSLSLALRVFPGAKIIFVSPEAFSPRDDILTELKKANLPFSIERNLQVAIPQADVIYMTRIQDEYDGKAGESSQVDMRAYSLKAEDLKNMRPNAVIMHPLPRREELPTTIDHDPRALYWKQKDNGLWMRGAILLSLWGRENLNFE